MDKRIDVPLHNPAQVALTDAMRLMLKAMPIGLECRTINNLGTVKRKDRTTWVLFADGITSRSRWGDLGQMTEDLVYFENNGVLPEPDRVHGF